MSKVTFTIGGEGYADLRQELKDACQAAVQAAFDRVPEHIACAIHKDNASALTAYWNWLHDTAADALREREIFHVLPHVSLNFSE